MTEKTLTEYYKSVWLPCKKIELKPTSYDRLYRTVTKNVIPYLGHIPMCEVELQQLLDFFEFVYGTYSLSTSKKIYEAVNACFKFAQYIGDVSKNPMLPIKKPKKNNFSPSKEKSILTPEEIKRLKFTISVRTYKSSLLEPYIGWGYYFLLNTGLRPCELLGLKWSDIKGDYIYIQRSVVSYHDEKNDNYVVLLQETLKTSSSRRKIYLNNNAKYALKQIASKTNPKGKFIMQHEGKIVKPDMLRRNWYALLKEAEVTPRELYCLRHTFASLLFRENCDIKSVSHIMGHSSVRTTYDTYIHLFEKNYKETNVLDRII